MAKGYLMQGVIVPAADCSVRYRCLESEAYESSVVRGAELLRSACLFALVCIFWGLVLFTALRVALQ